MPVWAATVFAGVWNSGTWTICRRKSMLTLFFKFDLNEWKTARDSCCLHYKTPLIFLESSTDLRSEFEVQVSFRFFLILSSYLGSKEPWKVNEALKIYLEFTFSCSQYISDILVSMLYIHVAKLCFEKYWIHQYADYTTCEDICMSAPSTHASLTAIPKIGIYRVVCHYNK